MQRGEPPSQTPAAPAPGLASPLPLATVPPSSVPTWGLLGSVFHPRPRCLSWCGHLTVWLSYLRREVTPGSHASSLLCSALLSQGRLTALFFALPCAFSNLSISPRKEPSGVFSAITSFRQSLPSGNHFLPALHEGHSHFSWLLGRWPLGRAAHRLWSRRMPGGGTPNAQAPAGE